MKKRKLMTPYLTGILLMVSMCMGTTVHAFDAVSDQETVIVEDICSQDEISISDEIISDDEDISTVPDEDPVPELPSADTDQIEDTPDEEVSEPEEKKEIVCISQAELFKDEETTLEADGFCDEEVVNLSHEVFKLIIPQELTVGKLIKPVFENAEVTVLVDGEELHTEEDLIDISSKAGEIGIRVKPLEDVLKQLQKLILTLSNDTSEEKEAVIETVLQRYFMDGSEDTTDIKELKIVLKGIKPVTNPDIGEDVDAEPELPDVQAPDKNEEDPDAPYEEEEKTDAKEEETKPQKNPVEHVFEIIDHSGLNLMDASVSVLDNKNLIFSPATQNSGTAVDTHYFQKEKIESVSVDEVDEKTEPKVSTSSSTSKGEKFVPFQLEKKNSETQSDNKKSNPVLIILLAVAAAACALFVPLAKKHHSDSREEKNGVK